jgi:hypothetical protein
VNARKRGNALLLCIGLVLVLFVSSAFLIQEADHDCCGEDCPICRTIAMTTALMQALCLIAAAQLMWSVLAVSRSAFQMPKSVRLHAEGTPVSRKTRIND